MNVRLEIYQSFIIPFDQKSPDRENSFYQLLDELQSLKNLELGIEDSSTAKVSTIKIDNPPNEVVNILKHKKYVMEDHLFKFIIEISYKNEIIEDYVKNDAKDIFYEVIIEDAVKRFNEFLIIVQICNVGCFQTGIGILSYDDNFKKIEIFNNYFNELLDFTLNNKWDIFTKIKIVDGWKWYIKNILPYGVDTVSQNSLSRAFNAYSYAFDVSHFTNKLIWIMIGIEAIYVQGKSISIREQISTKIELLLGGLSGSKRRLKKMYDYRSDLLHGRIELPNYKINEHEIALWDLFENDYYETTKAAESILIATFQQMIIKKTSYLNYRLILD